MTRPIRGTLRHLLSLLVVAFLAASLPAAAEAPRLGPEQALDPNPPSALSQARPYVAPASDGSFLTAWSFSDPTLANAQIFARPLSAAGVPTGEPVPVAGPAEGTQILDLVHDVGGSDVFALVWGTLIGFENNTLWVRFLDADGRPLGQAIPLDGVDPYSGFTVDRLVGFAFDAARGEMVAAWTDLEAGATAPVGFTDIFARRFDLDGNPLGETIPLAETTALPQEVTGLVLRPDGSFVVSWESDGGESRSGEVMVRAFGADDEPLTGEIPLVSDQNQAATEQLEVSIDGDDLGRILAVWTGLGDGVDDGGNASYGIAGRWLDRDLAFLTDTFPIHRETRGDQRAPRVAVAPDGNALVTWGTTRPVEDGGPDVETLIVARRVTPPGAGGAPLGADLVVNETPAAFSQTLFIDPAIQPADTAAVVWIGEPGPLDPLLAYGRLIFDLDQPAPPDGPVFTSPNVPGFDLQVRITSGGDVREGVLEADCIPETACFSGALEGRTEVFVRIIGPRPNGFLWPVITRFTPSQVEVWMTQRATGALQYYRLEEIPPGSEELSGQLDRTGFRPVP